MGTTVNTSRKYGTYLVELTNGKKFVCGNNYKPWWQHAYEHIFSNYKDPEHGWRYEDIAGIVESVKYCSTTFCDDGGLKWCDAEHYQEVIDDVAKEKHMEFKPFTEYKWQTHYQDKAKLIKEMRKW